MRCNGTFRYKQPGGLVRGADGFFEQVDEADWLPGCECQIEKQVPAKQVKGTDGELYSYSYTLFIQPHCTLTLGLNDLVEIRTFEGSVDEFRVKGVDDMNGKYIEVWG